MIQDDQGAGTSPPIGTYRDVGWGERVWGFGWSRNREKEAFAYSRVRG